MASAFVGALIILLAHLSLIDVTDPPQWHLMHQSGYNVLLHRTEIHFVNNSYLRSYQGGYVLYNRTHRALNFSGYFLRDVDDLKLEIRCYKLASNEYRYFPLEMTIDLCKEYNLNSFDIKNLLFKTSNFKGCPMKKGYYYMKYLRLDYSKFPPYIPYGDYKTVCIFKRLNSVITEIHAFSKVVSNNQYN